jgi:hypothetical protein
MQAIYAKAADSDVSIPRHRYPVPVAVCCSPASKLFAACARPDPVPVDAQRTRLIVVQPVVCPHLPDQVAAGDHRAIHFAVYLGHPGHPPIARRVFAITGRLGKRTYANAAKRIVFISQGCARARRRHR